VRITNQVSLIVNNAAGLISNAAIEYASFEGAIHVNLSSPYSGTVFPIGTPQQPVNNWHDAYLLAFVRGIKKLHIHGFAMLDTDELDFSGFHFYGEAKTNSILFVTEKALVTGCSFFKLYFMGFVSGFTTIVNCRVENVSGLCGCIEQCVLNGSYLVLSGDTIFVRCSSGNPQDGIPVVDLNGSGNSLIVKGHSGSLELKNKTGNEIIELDLDSGHIRIDESVVNGVVVVRGIGSIDDHSVNTMVITEDLINLPGIGFSVWDTNIVNTTAGQTLLNPLLKILGLSQENYFMDQTQYDQSGNLLSARLRLYTQSESVGTGDDVLETYEVTAQYTENRLQDYKVVKV
jgi:hypothetical protein